MIDLSSPVEENEFNINNNSITNYLKQFSSEDFESGINNIAYTIHDIIGINDDSNKETYISMLISIINNVFNEWNEKIKREVGFLSECENIKNDVLTLSAILLDKN